MESALQIGFGRGATEHLSIGGALKAGPPDDELSIGGPTITESAVDLLPASIF